jgi:hypothetical protein
MTRPEAAEFLGIRPDRFHHWEADGRIDIARYRRTRETGTPILYTVADLTRLREKLARVGKPYPDPDRSGCYRVPLRITKNGGGYVEAIIDAEDLPIVAGRRWNYTVRRTPDGDRDGCVILAVHRGHKPQLRRLIMGVEEKGLFVLVGHANGDPLDCRRCNLVVRTAAERTRGYHKFKHRQGRPTTSRFKGVCWNEREGKWFAQIGYQNQRIKLGTFGCEEDAAVAYDEAARTYFGAEARVNFPERGELATALVLPPPAVLPEPTIIVPVGVPIPLAPHDPLTTAAAA